MRSKQKSVSKTKKQWVLFLTGLTALLIGAGILLFFGIRKLYRIQQKHQLMRENPVVEIAALNIKAPVLEGTDQQTIAKAVGHFAGTGDFGQGNYCIAGHSSTLYKEYFNNLKRVETGMTITLYDKQKNRYATSATTASHSLPVMMTEHSGLLLPAYTKTVNASATGFFCFDGTSRKQSMQLKSSQAEQLPARGAVLSEKEKCRIVDIDACKQRNARSVPGISISCYLSFKDEIPFFISCGNACVFLPRISSHVISFPAT